MGATVGRASRGGAPGAPRHGTRGNPDAGPRGCSAVRTFGPLSMVSSVDRGGDSPRRRRGARGSSSRAGKRRDAVGDGERPRGDRRGVRHPGRWRGRVRAWPNRNRRRVAKLKPGDVACELALLTGAKPDATVAASASRKRRRRCERSKFRRRRCARWSSGDPPRWTTSPCDTRETCRGEGSARRGTTRRRRKRRRTAG